VCILLLLILFYALISLNPQYLSLQQLIGKDPDTLIAKGQELLDQRKYEEAVYFFNNLLNKGISPTQSYAGRGNAFLGLNRFDEAIRDFTNSLNIETTVDVLASRCSTFRIYTKFNEAINDCAEALILDPLNQNALIAASMLNIDRGEFSEARKLIESLIHLYPEQSSGFYVLAQLQMVEGPSISAIDSLSKAIELDPNILQYYWDRGFLYFSNGQISEARNDMTQILEIANPMTDGDLIAKAETLLNSFSGFKENNPQP